MERLAPIILFVYNRPEHTRKTIEALSKNVLAGESELYIFADAAKVEEDKMVQETRDYIKNLENKRWFKKVVLSMQEEHRGLAESVLCGVSKIIAEYEKVIVLEDDIVTEPSFLEYMNDALAYYQSNEKIWSISGYTLEMKSLRKYSDSVYFGYRASSWGWGTWINRWEKVDWQVKDFETFLLDESMRKRFNRGGEDLCLMLENQMKGKIDSWAIRWCYQQSKEDMLTVFPKVSYVRNIGCDGSGTHSGKTTQFDVERKGNHIEKETKFIEPYLDKKVIKEFHDICTGTFKIRVRNKLKRMFGIWGLVRRG